MAFMGKFRKQKVENMDSCLGRMHLQHHDLKELLGLVLGASAPSENFATLAPLG